MKKFISMMLVVMLLAGLLAALPMTALAEGTGEGGVSTVETEGGTGGEGAGSEGTGGGETGGEGTGGETPTPPPAPPAVTDNVNLAIKSYAPTSMVTGGDVTPTIVVTNNGTEIQNAKLSIGGNTVAEYGTMAAGASETYSQAYNVSADKLDQDIEVVFSYTIGGEAKTKRSSFKVAKKSATVEVSTAVKADSENVASGSKVKLTFAIENKGNVSLEKVTVTVPELNKGKPLESPFTLAAGESKVITYTATINETTPIEGVLSYIADGKTYTDSMEALTINVDQVSVSLMASVSNAYPTQDEELTFTVSIVNGGNVNMSNLALSTTSGDVVALSSTSLPAEGTLEATYSTMLEESGLFGFVLTAKDEAGAEYSYTSNQIDIVVQEPPAQDYTGQLSLVVTADTSDYKKNNRIVFTLTVNNTGETAFSNVRITEDTLGDLGIADLETLYPGEKTFTYELVQELEESKSFYFKMLAVDPDEYTVVVSANAIEVGVNEKKSGGSMGVFLWIVIIILVLLIGGGVALIVLMVKEKKEKQAHQNAGNKAVTRRTVQRSAAARQPGAESQARTARPAPANVEVEEYEPFQQEEQAPRYQPFAEELQVETEKPETPVVSELAEMEEQAAEVQPEAEALEAEPAEEAQPEVIEEFPQRRRERPAAPKRVNKPGDFMDRNNF